MKFKLTRASASYKEEPVIVEVNTINELMALIEREGDNGVIITSTYNGGLPTIKVYDDYVE